MKVFLQRYFNKPNNSNTTFFDKRTYLSSVLIISVAIFIACFVAIFVSFLIKHAQQKRTTEFVKKIEESSDYNDEYYVPFLQKEFLNAKDPNFKAFYGIKMFDFYYSMQNLPKAKEVLLDVIKIKNLHKTIRDFCILHLTSICSKVEDVKDLQLDKDGIYFKNTVEEIIQIAIENKDQKIASEFFERIKNIDDFSIINQSRLDDLYSLFNNFND